MPNEEKSGEVAPLRISFIPVCGKDLDEQNLATDANSHIPHVDLSRPRPNKLAVVGGSPSARKYLEELRQWDGDVWGINSTAVWLNDNGVKATFFTVDPMHEIGKTIGKEEIDRVPNAIIASCVDSSILDAFEGRAEKFHMFETGIAGGIPGGTTSATRVQILAVLMGYKGISFFGCDSSIDDGMYAYRKTNQEESEEQLLVKAGGEIYKTTPQLYIQAEQLSTLLSEYSEVFINRSEGLLKAMIENKDTWEVVAVSESLKWSIEQTSGSSVFTETYEVAI